MPLSSSTSSSLIQATPSFLKSVPAGSPARATKETRVVNVNGKKFYVSADAGDVASLDRQEAAIFRQIFAEASSATNQRRDASGKFVSEADAEAVRAAEAQVIVDAEETIAERLEREYGGESVSAPRRFYRNSSGN